MIDWKKIGKKTAFPASVADDHIGCHQHCRLSCCFCKGLGYFTDCLCGICIVILYAICNMYSLRVGVSGLLSEDKAEDLRQ